jgi:AraC-like DNA-binding protein
MGTAIPVDVRASAAAPASVTAGTFAFDGEDAVSGWHHHDLHQVEYAFEGTVEVETESARFLLPPQQALWIPAGLVHRTTLRQVRTVSVFFAPELVDRILARPGAGPALTGAGVGDHVRVLAAAPVLKEMILYARRWPIGRASSDAVADGYFEVLARLVIEWLDHEVPLWLPTSTDPAIAAAMAYTDAHLGSVTVAEVGRAVGLSERALRRHFVAVTGMTWRRYLLESRLLRATARLADPNSNIMDIATEVGFASASAFSRAFRRYAGSGPGAYRRGIAAASAELEDA